MFLNSGMRSHSAPIVLVMAVAVFISPQAHASGKKHHRLWQITESPDPGPQRVAERDTRQSGSHVVANKPAAIRKSKIEIKPGTVFKDCRKCPEMIVIPGGSSDAGVEGSVYPVTLESFAMSKTEVTQGQWKAIMGNNPSLSASCGDNCPVDQVSWNDVQEFILRLDQKTGKKYRLPTAAEWEYACRAGARQEYCGSDNADSVAWYKSNSGGKVNPVARKQANAFGLYDMSGNAWEWVEDNGSDATAASPVEEKQADTSQSYYTSGDDWEWGDDDYRGSYSWGAAQGSTRQGDVAKRMLYGGSWLSSQYGVRAARRIRVEPDNRSGNFGFRLARTLP